MSKVYKGHELLKEIANGNIKEGTQFKNLNENPMYDNRNIYVYKNNNLIGRFGGMNIIAILNDDFEIIEEEPEIDIQGIEKLETISELKSVCTKVSREENLKRIDKAEIDYFYKINDLVRQQNEILRAVKQLDNQINNK